jgi:hypothetical protein
LFLLVGKLLQNDNHNNELRRILFVEVGVMIVLVSLIRTFATTILLAQSWNLKVTEYTKEQVAINILSSIVTGSI